MYSKSGSSNLSQTSNHKSAPVRTLVSTDAVVLALHLEKPDHKQRPWQIDNAQNVAPMPIKPKLLLIGLHSPTEERAGSKRPDQLAVDECRPEAIQSKLLNQFVHGFYCERRGSGFVPNDLIKDDRGEAHIDKA